MERLIRKKMRMMVRGLHHTRRSCSLPGSRKLGRDLNLLYSLPGLETVSKAFEEILFVFRESLWQRSFFKKFRDGLRGYRRSYGTMMGKLN